MAVPRTVEPVVRLCAVFSRYPEARVWAKRELQQRWGTPLEETPEVPFDSSPFYERTMGPGLVKQWIAFAEVASPGSLADWKLETNHLEAEYAIQANTPETRPLNLDPGYVTQAKLVLATTKDRDHRVYLRDGIFAEVTLSYTGRRWVDHRWTYPDYRTEPLIGLVQRCREHLREHLRRTGVRRQA